jgi:hypothetical protein
MTRFDVPARCHPARGRHTTGFVATLALVCFVALASTASGQIMPSPAPEPATLAPRTHE